MGLEARGRGDMEEEEKEEEKEKEEKIPHMCKSIGHRPLWGRCPKRREKEERKRHQQTKKCIPKTE